MNNNLNIENLTKETIKKNVKIFGADKYVPEEHKKLNNTQRLILEDRKAIY